MTKAFDPTRPVQTRDGRKARIVCVDALGAQPIVALVEGDKYETEGRHYMDGFYQHDRVPSLRDLINIPQKREGWVNVYPASLILEMPCTEKRPPVSCAFASEEEANKYAQFDRIACIRIEWTED
jgi:hypothetical protein